MEPAGGGRQCTWQVLCCLSLCSLGFVSGQLRYSVPEESEPGTLVGNLARDLGLDAVAVYQRKLSLGYETDRRYFALSQGSGVLVVKERLDRESLCGPSARCVLFEEVIIESPLELFRVELEVLDINDNAPSFLTDNRVVKVTELVAARGTRFPLESAQDPDVGSNTVSDYTLNPNPYFSLTVNRRSDGKLLPELVLEKVLDREAQENHSLVLTAIDGGRPAKSGSTQITVIVLDINDNAPTFDHSTYTVSVQENLPVRSVLIKLNAIDIDEGPNGDIEYSFEDHMLESTQHLFSLDSHTGEITLTNAVDYEEANLYELSILAQDKGVPVMVGRCFLHVKIEDVNDNVPEIIMKSNTFLIPENTPTGTAVGFFRVRDRDSGYNGEVRLEISPNVPFTFKSSGNHHSLVTDGVLDRENIAQYAIKVVATDMGSPPLQAQATIHVNISDVNDNPPLFSQPLFGAHVMENNSPGYLLCTVSASDPDEGENSQLTFSITESDIEGSPITSFVRINSLTGNIYAQRSFDYESVQVLHVPIKVEDAGSPKLSSNMSVHVFIVDQNDNSPSVLYPVASSRPYVKQKIPKYVPKGYLVSKLTAVDADSGHNAWLSYSLLKPTDTSLFRVTTHSGEIRSVKEFKDIDDSEYTLILLIQDNGRPSLSTTVTILLSSEEKTNEEMPKSHNFHVQYDGNSEMTEYLIITLVTITGLLVVTFIMVLTTCLRRQDTGTLLCCSATTLPKKYSKPFQPSLQLNEDGTLKYLEVSLANRKTQSHCYRTCSSPVSERSDFTFMKPLDFPQLKSILNEEDAFLSTVHGLKEPEKVRSY